MKNYRSTGLSLACLTCLLMLLSGCYISIGGCVARAKYQRQVQLSAPLQPGSTFAAQTHNGSITINGVDIPDCNLAATITAQAVTEGDAIKLAEQVKITLVPSNNKLTAKIEKPVLTMNQSISVSFDVLVPNQTNLELTTHNGSVTLANIEGQVDATTHNGKVTTEIISGSSRLKTHNGSITCEEISGDTQLRTHNGRVKVFYSNAAPSVCDISIVTHNGGIDLTAPPNFSGEVEASTHNGSINTNLPITVIGKVSKRRLTGTIGTGQGKLHLETYNGSIKIK